MSTLGGDMRAVVEQRPKVAYRTGFHSLDRVTGGGLRAGELSVIGALSGRGKTACAEQMALDVALEHDVLFVPLEMGRDETLARMGAKLARCSVTDFRRAGMDMLVEEQINRRKLRIADPPRSRPLSVSAIARLVDRAQPKVVVLDYVRLIAGWLVDGSAHAHIGPTKIVQQLVDLAATSGAHIVVCQQLNAPKTQRRPVMDDLMDTRALGHAASLVVLLHRPFRGHGVKKDWITEILLDKNRHGYECMLHYRWVGETMSFWGMTEEERAAPPCCVKRAAKKAEVDTDA